MNVCLLIIKAYDAHGPAYTSRFSRLTDEHALVIRENLEHPDSTVADIVVFPDSFAAAMRDFNLFCVDPEPSR